MAKALYSRKQIPLSHGVMNICMALLSLDKSFILLCGRQSQPNNCSMHGTVIKSVDTLTDLGDIRSPDDSCAAHYADLIAKARKAVGLIYIVLFAQGKNNTLVYWDYIRLKSVCDPNADVLFISVESALAEKYLSDRKNTKKIYQKIYAIKDLTYIDWLRALTVLTLLRSNRIR